MNIRPPVTALLLLILLQGQPASAQQTEVETLQDQVEQLQDEVTELESRIARLERMLQSNASSRQPPQRDANTSGWRDRQNWRRLEDRMSKAEVRQILGEPGKVSSASYGDTWYYPDVLGGTVSFDRQDRVDGWDEP